MKDWQLFVIVAIACFTVALASLALMIRRAIKERNRPAPRVIVRDQKIVRAQVDRAS